MDATSANRIVAIGLFFTTAVVFAFAFFNLTGGFRAIGLPGLPGTTYRYDDDVTAAPPKPRVAEPAVSRAPSLDEPFRPQTAAEQAHFSAIEKLQQRDARVGARVAERQKLLDFAGSEAGKELQRALDLARESKFAEAKAIFGKLVEQIGDLDARIRFHILKTAVLVYQQAGDRAGLKELLRRYLGVVEEELSRADLDERKRATSSELLDQVQEALGEVEAE